MNYVVYKNTAKAIIVYIVRDGMLDRVQSRTYHFYPNTRWNLKALCRTLHGYTTI